MSQSHRLPDGGRIDRSRSLSFLFDGNRYEGHPGDTLASALIANGVHLVGRSFKYHRPRGIFSAGSEEPNALIQLGLGNHTEPNLRAPQIELYDGLVASSQNRFPSLSFDLGEVNDIAAPLIPSGFYYKTFMWPKRGWMSYERAIRRMAGLGRAPDGPDPDIYEHRHAHCDVLVAGGGVTGLAAALAAGRAGARVILADEQAEMGGWLLSEGDGETGTRISGKPAADWVEKTVAELAAMENVTLLRRTTAFGYYDHNWLGLAERVTDHLGPFAPPHLPRQRLWKLRAKQVVLAAGAIERPLVFSGNDRPGILLAGAVRSYVARYGTRPGNALVVVTSNDSGYLTALEAHRAGIGVAAIVDTRPTADGALPQAARKAGLRIYQGHGVIGTTGRLRVDGVRLAKLSADGGRIEGKGFGIPCDLVAMSGGWNPNVSLFSQSRGKLSFREADGVFIPGQATQPLRSAGMGNGVLSTADCLAQGFAAGTAAANDTGFTGRKGAQPEDRGAGGPGSLPHLAAAAGKAAGAREMLRRFPERRHRRRPEAGGARGASGRSSM
ncbi:2Fe-2S iron-sulfur cluster-binding protein [Oceanibaculum nanhaiense]|uniref:2Fe-2S iron-sulfur cluster-binding protein n=1 Tax=Oceanibaculum nanhaiense TaxID=1909734 RepID=UPI003D28BA88